MSLMYVLYLSFSGFTNILLDYFSIKFDIAFLSNLNLMSSSVQHELTGQHFAIPTDSSETSKKLKAC